jgi:hypothetical protein
MQVELPDKTIRDTEAMLAKRGQNGNVSEFIDRTLQRALFFETVRDIRRQNTRAVGFPVLPQFVRQAAGCDEC